MGTEQFFRYLSLVEEYAFHICETAIFLTFIWVYGNLAIKHIFEIGRKGNWPSQASGPSQLNPRLCDNTAAIMVHTQICDKSKSRAPGHLPKL